ncbi:MAG: hypothetical protein ACJAVO_000886 [Parvibaculaceae bacterium]|jgi:hypothetical protein
MYHMMGVAVSTSNNNDTVTKPGQRFQHKELLKDALLSVKRDNCDALYTRSGTYRVIRERL